jgi:hypothetical protein
MIMDGHFMAIASFGMHTPFGVLALFGGSLIGEQFSVIGAREKTAFRKEEGSYRR